MEQERDNEVIYLKDLIFTALYQWRRILVAGLVLGLMLGAVGAVGLFGSKSVESELVDQVLLQDEQDAQLLWERNEAYSSNSLLLKLDPYCIYTASVELTVDTGYQIRLDQVYQTPDITEPLLNAYKVEIATTVAKSMAQALDVELKYLQEVLRIERSSGTRSLRVTVKCVDDQSARKLLQVITDSLTQLHTHTAETIGPHTVKVLSSSVDQIIDLTVEQSQIKNKEQQDALQKNLEAARKAVADAEGASVKKAVILAVLGVFGGAFAVAGWVWVKHIAGTGVYSQRTLENHTGLQVLGCAPGSETKCAMDRWLKKLEGRSTDAEAMDVAAAHVANLCGGEKLMVIGSADKESRALLLEALKQAGVQAEDFGSILRNPQAVKALPGCEKVLLAEQCMVSKYPEAAKAAQIVADQGKQLLGCVLLDG